MPALDCRRARSDEQSGTLAEVSQSAVSPNEFFPNTMTRPALAAIACSFAFFMATNVVAETLYRWVDDNGNVHYSDQVPPEQAQHRRAKLNERGMVVEETEAARSAEQLEQERQLKRLRAEQDRLLAEQADRDRSLLRTFRSVEEIKVALQGKLNTIDAQIKITQANLQRLDEARRAQEQRAAALEKGAQAIPKNLLDSISGSRKQTTIDQEKIKQLEFEKQNLRVKFEKDMDRFIALTARSGDASEVLAQYPQQPASVRETGAPILSAVVCTEAPVCDSAWRLAKQYVQLHANTRMAIETDKILKTSEPSDGNGMSLLVTRIAGKTGETLFLDVRCKSSSLGQEFCASQKVRAIRSGFQPYVEAGLRLAR
jgi:hypothetical protein